MDRETVDLAQLQGLGSQMTEAEVLQMRLQRALEAVHSESLPTRWALDGQKHTPFGLQVENLLDVVDIYCEAVENYRVANDCEHNRRIAKLRSMPYAEYLKTEEWGNRRFRHVCENGYRCQLCGLNSKTLHVHHNTYKHLGFEDTIDLIALCPDCHAKFHDKLASP